MTLTVAWMDIGDRIAVCPACVPGEIAKNPAAFDVTPITVGGAEGKGCAECGESLVGDAKHGSEILPQEWVA